MTADGSISVDVRAARDRFYVVRDAPDTPRIRWRVLHTACGQPAELVITTDRLETWRSVWSLTMRLVRRSTGLLPTAEDWVRQTDYGALLEAAGAPPLVDWTRVRIEPGLRVLS